MAEQRIRVVIVEPEKPARIAVIPNTVEAMKEIVGGFFEHHQLEDDVYLVCNDVGMNIGLPLNHRFVLREPIAGTFFVCRIRGGEYWSLTEDEAERWQKEFSLGVKTDKR